MSRKPMTGHTLIRKIEKDIERSLELLRETVEVEPVSVDTHQLVRITGIDQSRECLMALAIYCVGQIAKAIQVNLEIRADLLGDNSDARIQLARDVYSVIGEDNSSLTDKQKRDERDPWLFEAISHLIVHLSRIKRELLPVGTLIALTMAHCSAKEKGLDLVAVYFDKELGLGIGESKAKEDDPSRGLREAIGKFSDVDRGEYDAQIREIVGLMRYALSAEYQEQITPAFWKNERAYLPILGYSSNRRPRWILPRKSLEKLAVPSTHRILMPLAIDEFRTFFDKLSDAMRCYLKSLGE